MKNDYQIGRYEDLHPPDGPLLPMGKMDDVRKAVTMDAKRPGDLVYVLGNTCRNWAARSGTPSKVPSETGFPR